MPFILVTLFLVVRKKHITKKGIFFIISVLAGYLVYYISTYLDAYIVKNYINVITGMVIYNLLILKVLLILIVTWLISVKFKANKALKPGTPQSGAP